MPAKSTTKRFIKSIGFQIRMPQIYCRVAKENETKYKSLIKRYSNPSELLNALITKAKTSEAIIKEYEKRKAEQLEDYLYLLTERKTNKLNAEDIKKAIFADETEIKAIEDEAFRLSDAELKKIKEELDKKEKEDEFSTRHKEAEMYRDEIYKLFDINAFMETHKECKFDDICKEISNRINHIAEKIKETQPKTAAILALFSKEEDVRPTCLAKYHNKYTEVKKGSGGDK